MTDKPKEYEIEAAFKANKALGDVVDDGLHRLSTKKGGEILRTYELAELSNIDALTGVGNVRAQENFFIEDEKRQSAFRKSVERRKDPPYPAFGLILYIDVDGLKKANDISRETGNTLLKRVVQATGVLAKRVLDKVYRQGGDGGDEFAVILPGDTEERMREVVSIFEKALKEMNTDMKVTASLAIGTYGNGKTARESVTELDNALKESKDKRKQRGAHVNTVFLRREPNV